MNWFPAWNWKSAVASSCCRALIFFSINLPAGMDAALAAMQTEFLYRAVMAGFYGSLTQYFARMKSERIATRAATIIVPGIAHVVELVVHHWAGTAVLGWSILGSILFSIVTTRFNLFAMRHGVLTVGRDSAPWSHDVRALPALVVAFFRTSPPVS